jgi:peptide deformylase
LSLLRALPRLRELLTHTLLLQRPLTVTVEFQDASGAKQRLALDELQARIFLHEFDHLQSVLFHDRMEPEVLATVQPQLDALEAAYAANRPAA